MANEFKAKNGVITPIVQSTVSTGTAPLTVASTTAVTNLNADYLDGQHGTYYLDLANATGTLAAAKGGTGQSSYTVGDLVYASTTTALSPLADVATGSVLISGGVGVAPSYGKVGLTTHVSGTLPVANGGTNASTAGIAAFNNITGYTAAGATGTTSTNLVFSTSPTLVTPILGTPQSVTLTNGTGLPLSSGVTGTLPIANGGTALTTTPTNGQLLIGNGTNYTLATLTAGTNITITNSSGGITIAASGGSSVSAATPSAAGTVYGFYDSTYNSVGFGIGTLNANSTTGRYNTGLGYQALYNNVSNNNVAVGFQALYSSAGVQATSGMKNTAIGYQAGYSTTTGNFNVYIGHEAAKNSTGGVTENVAIGLSAGSYTTGSNNTIVGSQAASGSTFSGGTNTAIGGSSGLSLTSGSTNTFLGYYSGKNVTTGGQNVYIGYQAGNGATTGSYNAFFGTNSGANSGITSSYNVILGSWNGYDGVRDIRTSDKNIVISNGNGDVAVSWNANRVGMFWGPMLEKIWKTTTAASATTINFDANGNDYPGHSVLWYSGTATGNWTLNVRCTSTSRLDANMPYNYGSGVGSVLTIAFMVTNGTTGYYPAGFQVDGSSKTVKWQGGSAPTSGNANSVDMYIYTIIMDAGGSINDVFGSQTRFA